jgi:hypothetical protein
MQYPPGGKKERDTPPEAASPVNLTNRINHYIKVTTNLPDDQIARVIAIARRSLAELVDDAEKALREKDYPALGHSAHKLKGILLQCGLSVLAEKAQDIHTRTKDPEDFLFADALDEIKTCVSELTTWE